MISTTRLLTKTISLANLTLRYVQIKPIDQQLKIILMKKISTRNLQHSRNLRTSDLENCQNTHCKLLEVKSNKGVNRKVKRRTMEPYTHRPMSENLATPSDTNGIQDIVLNVSWAQKNHIDVDRKKYKDIRQWKPTHHESSSVDCESDFVFRLLSYNILAQNLLETHSYLYNQHFQKALDWKLRKLLVQNEIIEANANVICIQEMQQEHLNEFLVPFLKNGYKYLYKKRTSNTNETKDGLLLLYRADQFHLEDYTFVEYYQTSSDILNRDNVGMVVKFSLLESENTHIVISTTHLLYNPNRNDVRLAQTQILLAELERFAFIENISDGPNYHPIILCGDFNLRPFTGVYQFITKGAYEFAGKNRTLGRGFGLTRLSHSLIPPSLLITDDCQHFNILSKRLRGYGTNKIMLRSSDETDYKNCVEVTHSDSTVVPIDIDSRDCQKIQIVKDQYAIFSSGSLRHPFQFSSVYKHMNYQRHWEATTHQDEWITVDYIFFSGLEVLAEYTLPTASHNSKLPFIPNFVVGSDHFCLGATFKLKKKAIR